MFVGDVLYCPMLMIYVVLGLQRCRYPVQWSCHSTVTSVGVSDSGQIGTFSSLLYDYYKWNYQ